jgi:hypothetical protein
MKHLLWFAALVLVLLLGDRLGAYFLAKKTAVSGFRYARMYNQHAGADILLLGNSRGLAFYQPYIERITGKKTFNLSYNGLPMDLAQVLVADYLERYSAPEILVLDITMCDRENDELLAAFTTYAAASPHLDSLIHHKIPNVWWGAQVSHLFRYNNEIFHRALYYQGKTDEDWLLDRVISRQLAANVADHSYDITFRPQLLEALKNTCAIARAKGVTTQLVIAPYFPGFRVNGLDAWKSAVEAATGLKVRDDRHLLNDPTLFGDFMHPNQQGSQVFMDSLFAHIGRDSF